MVQGNRNVNNVSRNLNLHITIGPLKLHTDPDI